jgi:hypothetical protein
VTTDGLRDRGLRCGEQAAEVVRLVSLGAEVIDWDGYPDNPDFVAAPWPKSSKPNSHDGS